MGALFVLAAGLGGGIRNLADSYADYSAFADVGGLVPVFANVGFRHLS